MIYRIKINGSPTASAQATSANGKEEAEAGSDPSRVRLKGRTDSWFVTQIESRFGQVIQEPLPHDWTDLFTRAAGRTAKKD